MSNIRQHTNVINQTGGINFGTNQYNLSSENINATKNNIDQMLTSPSAESLIKPPIDAEMDIDNDVLSGISNQEPRMNVQQIRIDNK